ncbi:hypothetical protein SDRG_12923 [Saprolegnia diclina VS20]|uniref:Amino acid transporter transmembrane domain-containing protein n=1 Tax=Saprolegnia diclina (strain VS20) TaxID=1156394 RepID=T0PUQ3_SAPDV|nr:hypothetical protein SDRG_12923 [Saprolegnia diclina VS20]EQC29254.1 hypothetical protein SDRG_12923 [Saprolegnia diclina VS20]|eukprot:XP_008617228.1 hypothetical protein SDRG_12923 [Saprolegnia diclina VS20]
MTFLTTEDLKMCFSLFCCVYGIGTLGMPANYARAGYYWATGALILMAAINVYASWCMAKVMMVAPRNVKTFGDLGEWSMGCFGRYAANISQLLVCVMVPIMFLVLGGSILTTLFPYSFKDSTWIIVMGVTLLPVCLIPTLKEGAGAAFAGALGTILADAIAVGVLVTNISEANAGLSAPKPDLSFKQVSTVFGNLALAYGAGIVIPTLTREHSEPSRMPRVIVVTLVIVSIFFMIVAVTGVYEVGCQIPGNLLFAIAGSKLGFAADRGAVALAFLFMQLHISVAFAVVMFPAFYIAERIFLRMHKTTIDRNERIDPNAVLENDAVLEEQTPKDVEYPSFDAAAEYRVPGKYLQVAVVRTVMVGLAVVVAIAWKDKFSDLLDFVGASSTATSCMILPLIFYLKTFWRSIGNVERAVAFFCTIVSIFFAIYVSITTGKTLFGTTSSTSVNFPFCHAAFQDVVYTNRSHYNYTSN